MGTIAARDAIRVLELTEQVAAGHVLACGQALKLRLASGEITSAMIPSGVSALMELTPLVEEDTPLDKVLTALTEAIAQRRWRLDWPDDAEKAE